MKLKIREGGAGSGNFGHAGRPGKVGGSLTGISKEHFNLVHAMVKKYVKNVKGADTSEAATLRGFINRFEGKDDLDGMSSKQVVSFMRHVWVTPYVVTNASKLVTEHFQAIKAYMEEQQAIFQRYLTDRGEKSAIFWRGVHSEQAKLLSKVKIGDTIELGPLMSTSFERHVAEHFSSLIRGRGYHAVLKFTGVSPADIFACPGLGAVSKLASIGKDRFGDTESEVILKGAAKWRVLNSTTNTRKDSIGRDLITQYITLEKSNG